MNIEEEIEAIKNLIIGQNIGLQNVYNEFIQIKKRIDNIDFQKKLLTLEQLKKQIEECDAYIQKDEVLNLYNFMQNFISDFEDMCATIGNNRMRYNE